MSALLVVARREYLETVQKKAFIIWTVLTPILFGGMMAIPGLMVGRSIADKRVLVVDASGMLEGSFAESPGDRAEAPRTGKRQLEVKTEVVTSGDLEKDREAALERLRGKEIDAVLVVPEDVASGGTPAQFYSRSATDVITRERIGRALDRAVWRARFAARGIAGEDSRALLAKVEIQALQATREGASRKAGGEETLLLAIGFGMMMMMPLLFQGQAILRGVVQEKTDRIVESLLSSMSAYDLLTGKVLGLCAVGLTQIAIWMAMGLITGTALAGPMLAAGLSLATLVSPVKLAYFVVFYLLGYFIYACVFAAGGACVNSEKEAQQILQPVMFVLMVPWILIFPVVTAPDSTLATVLSLVPVYTPITMFIRVLVGEPPGWQIALSVLLSLASIFGLFWVAARIFRVGILWYGKRPSLPEFLRWVKEAR